MTEPVLPEKPSREASNVILRRMSLANTRGDDPTDPVLRLQDVEAIVQDYFCESKDGDEPGSVCEIDERYWQAHQATTKELLAKSMKESWAAFVFCGGTSSAYSDDRSEVDDLCSRACFDQSKLNQIEEAIDD
jgi:hypothetical protein